MDSLGSQSQGVGPLLRHWRGVRRKSQLALALDAGVSARHLSFIETGRANPSRSMVIGLASALDVPLRERNHLLSAAGYAPVYSESSLDEPELAQVQNALRLILDHQEPFPAVVMDRHWNLIDGNRAATALFGRLLDGPPREGRLNVLRLMFDPDGVRRYVENWDRVARSLLGRVQREAVCGVPDPELRRLVEELLSYPDVPRGWGRQEMGGAGDPVIPVTFRKGPLRLSYFSTVTTLGTPQDVTLQEIRIECFFPADAATESQVVGAHSSGHGDDSS